MNDTITSPNEDIETLKNLIKSQQYDEALLLSGKLLKAKSPSSELYNITGALHAKLNKMEDAVSLFLYSLKLTPDNANVHYNLAKAYDSMDQQYKAIHHYQKAIDINPEFFHAYVSLGYLLQHSDRLDEAERYLAAAIELKPDNITPYNYLGYVYLELSQYSKAKELFEKALALESNDAKTLYNLGCYYQFSNQKETAIEYFHKALEVNPDLTSCYQSLNSLEKFNVESQHVKHLIYMLDQDNLSADNKVKIHFVLSKVYENAKDQEKFLQHLALANDTQKKFLSYQVNDDLKLFKNIKKIFKSIDISDHRYTLETDSNIRPIFIVGMPRSGTTLVEQIISSHSSVYGAGELSFLNKEAWPVIYSLAKNQSPSALREKTKEVMKHYLEDLMKLSVSERIITDKMPLNFKWLGFVLTALPDVKIINLNRDPMAICWSIYKQYFPAKGLGFAYDLKDLGAYYNQYLALMDFWRKKFPDRIYDVNYELLTENQEEETRKLLEYCGLQWEESCLNFHKTDRAVRTASLNQVRNKMYRGSSESWKQYEDFLEPLKKALPF